jgi:phosphatidylglycerol:prolipoprotein diacylglycerol transferase
MIGGAVGLIAFFYKYKMPPLATLDLIAPSLMLGIAIGRIGCFLNGCCFGGTCDLPWAVTFPSRPWASPTYVYQVQHGDTFLQGLKIVGNPGDEPVIREVQAGSAAEKRGLEPGQQEVSINGRQIRTIYQAQRQLMYTQRSEKEIVIQTDGDNPVVRWPVTGPPPRSEPVHPTQLYSSLNGFLLCLLLVAYAPFRRHDGEVLAILLTLSPFTRFLLEILRTDEPGVFGTCLTISQTSSLILLLCAVALWAYVLTKLPGMALARHEESNATRRGVRSFKRDDTQPEAASSSSQKRGQRWA